MKNTKKGLMIASLFLLSIFSISFALAATDTYYPFSGVDTTSSHNLTTSDLNLVSASDNDRYQSKGNWNSNNFQDSKYIEWDFNPDLSSCNINSVKINFEWQRGLFVQHTARLLVWDQSAGVWVEQILSAPAVNSDVSETIDVSSYINSVSDINNLKIKFQAADCEASILKTQHDLVSVDVKYTPYDTTAPTCTIDYLEDEENADYNLVDDGITYINKADIFYAYGTASDSESPIANVQYNKSSPDKKFGFTNVDPLNGAFDELNEDWRSYPYDPANTYVEGLHTLCCRVTDRPCSGGQCGTAGNTAIGECRQVCIDLTAPIMDTINDNTQDCDETSTKYSNQDTITWSWTSHDTPPCGAIDYYSIELYKDSELYDTATVDEPDKYWTTDTLTDGTYYIKVSATDKAGHTGNSITSESIIVDLTNPIVEITGPSNEGWYDPGFSLTETDTDTNLKDCYYRITNEGNVTQNWTSTICNDFIFIDVSTYCSVDGACKVEKKATDKACNIGTDERTFNVDTHSPIVNKEVGTPKVAPWGNWIEILTNGWFITDDTQITLSCDDGQGSGVQAVYYKLNNDSWNEYSEPLTLSEDGLYTIDYYCIDNVNKSSEIESETDKVDNIAPVTTKTIGEPKYNEGYYITNHTSMVLLGFDDEVGCSVTNYDINGIPQSQSENCNVTVDWTNRDDGVYTIGFWSVDLLLNYENATTQDHYLDNSPPTIWVLNPTLDEADSVEKCMQSVVAIVNDGEGSGVKKVWAELYDNTNMSVRTVNMSLTKYGTYESLMDKQLPAGYYTLKVYAEDNLGNVEVVMIKEHLTEGIFVENIYPPLCSIDPTTGGSCDFTFHVCVRNTTSVKMWMDKLSEIATPGMMNATILKNNESAYVGLKNDSGPLTDAELLRLSEEVINGRTNFDLHLEIPSDIASGIGEGSHSLDYLIKSYLDIVED
jgi:hypothetical protein